MTDRPSNSYIDKPDVPPDAVPGHHALLSLHALSGSFKGVDLGVLPEFRSSSPATALRAVAEAPEDEIPVSARLSVLYDLAKAGPDLQGAEDEYRRLAESVAGARGLDAGQLLTDLKQSASGMMSLRETPSGRALPYHETAFIGQDVCSIRTVQVGGLAGTWIFSEFETDATFESVAEWVDPRNWPERGPMLFKRMDIVGAAAPVDIPPERDGHWHGVFHEEVQLVQRLNTLLHCDFWQTDRSAGMTYELDVSLDDELDVDRGFLLVNDLGAVRRVKALKIVGFTNDVWDRVAQIVCPFWTDFVRAAVEGGSSSVPKPGTHTPVTPSGRPRWGDTFQEWVDLFGDAARTYFDLFDDVTSRVGSGGYGASDLLTDGTKYWSQLATDWARAWSYSLDTLDQVADQGPVAGLKPSVRARAGAGAPPYAGAATGARTAAGAPGVLGATTAAATQGDGTIIPVPGLREGDRPVCSDLMSIEAGGAKLTTREISVSVQALDEGTYGVRLQTANTSLAPGLYVGRLTTPEGATLAPVQLYLSRATGA
jgi:hypothetical protein